MVVLTDRDFGQTELAVECPKVGLEYLLRVCPDVTIKTRRWRGVLRQYPIRKGGMPRLAPRGLSQRRRGQDQRHRAVEDRTSGQNRRARVPHHQPAGEVPGRSGD